MSRLRESAYVYGPKCDCFASQGNWRDPYPISGPFDVDPACYCTPCQPILAQVIQAAAHEADANLVDFVWALSPLHSGAYDFTSGDFDKMKSKIDNVRSLGVHKFALFVDDIGGGSTADDHANLMNALDDYIHTTDASEHLLVVGAHYRGGPNSYTDTLGAKLHPDIEVMWTGTDVEPPTISAGDLTGINMSLGRHVSIWDNWPTTSSEFTGRSADLPTAAMSFFTNPVLSECNGHPADASAFDPVLGPIADYLWDSERYAASGDSQSASYNAWQARKKAVSDAVSPCTPCGNYAVGWTCATDDMKAIIYCDGQCTTRIACPGGCVHEMNPNPDVCN
jgi:hyaluronoglucosaminidase